MQSLHRILKATAKLDTATAVCQTGFDRRALLNFLIYPLRVLSPKH